MSGMINKRLVVLAMREAHQEILNETRAMVSEVGDALEKGDKGKLNSTLGAMLRQATEPYQRVLEHIDEGTFDENLAAYLKAMKLDEVSEG